MDTTVYHYHHHTLCLYKQKARDRAGKGAWDFFILYIILRLPLASCERVLLSLYADIYANSFTFNVREVVNL